MWSHDKKKLKNKFLKNNFHQINKTYHEIKKTKIIDIKEHIFLYLLS